MSFSDWIADYGPTLGVFASGATIIELLYSLFLHNELNRQSIDIGNITTSIDNSTKQFHNSKQQLNMPDTSGTNVQSLNITGNVANMSVLLNTPQPNSATPTPASSLSNLPQTSDKAVT